MIFLYIPVVQIAHFLQRQVYRTLKCFCIVHAIIKYNTTIRLWYWFWVLHSRIKVRQCPEFNNTILTCIMTNNTTIIRKKTPRIYYVSWKLSFVYSFKSRTYVYSLYSSRYYIRKQHGKYVCAWAEARSHDLSIESRALYHLSSRGHLWRIFLILVLWNSYKFSNSYVTDC